MDFRTWRRNALVAAIGSFLGVGATLAVTGSSANRAQAQFDRLIAFSAPASDGGWGIEILARSVVIDSDGGVIQVVGQEPLSEDLSDVCRPAFVGLRRCAARALWDAGAAKVDRLVIFRAESEDGGWGVELVGGRPPASGSPPSCANDVVGLRNCQLARWMTARGAP